MSDTDSRRRFRVACDTEHCPTVVLVEAPAAAVARAMVGAAGWTRAGEGDRCPAHREALTSRHAPREEAS